MKTRKIQVRPVAVVETAKEEVVSVLVTMLENSPVAPQLGSILEAWKLLGNRWLSCMEANLELDVLNRKVADTEKGDIELNGIRALVFMKYMIERKGGFADGWLVTYKLSDQGKKAVNMKDLIPSPGTRIAKPKSAQLNLTDALVECSDCRGAGVLDSGDLCAECMGTGETNSYKALAKSIAPNAVLNPVKTKHKVVTRRK